MSISNKLRKIVDFKNLTPELMEALEDRYGGDYEAETIRFRNAQGDLISAVPIETESTVYLVKMSVHLKNKLEELAAAQEDDDDEEEDDMDEESIKARWEEAELVEDESDEEED